MTAWGATSSSIDRLSATPYIAAMAIREILVIPDKRLRLKSEPVSKIDSGEDRKHRAVVAGFDDENVRTRRIRDDEDGELVNHGVRTHCHVS